MTWPHLIRQVISDITSISFSQWSVFVFIASVEFFVLNVHTSRLVMSPVAGLLWGWLFLDADEFISAELHTFTPSAAYSVVILHESDL